MKVECYELKIYTIDPKASTKMIEQKKIIDNKPTNKTKLNHKRSIQLIPKNADQRTLPGIKKIIS